MPDKKYMYIIYTKDDVYGSTHKRDKNKRHFSNVDLCDKLCDIRRRYHEALKVEVYRKERRYEDYKYLFTIIFERGLLP